MTACGDGVSLPSGVTSTSVCGRQACQCPLLQNGANTALMRDNSRDQKRKGLRPLRWGRGRKGAVWTLPKTVPDAHPGTTIPTGPRRRAPALILLLQPRCFHSPWTEQPCRLQSMGSQRVRHDRATKRAHKDTSRIGLEPTARHHFNIIIFLKTIPPNTVIF